MQLTFQTESGKTFHLESPVPRAGGSIFVVAGHKTGSTLLENIIKDISGKSGLPCIPVESGVWNQGISLNEWPQDLYRLLEKDGLVFHSFRWLQKLPGLASFPAARKIFMIRDPRDVAVSYYYSMAKSHQLPPSGKSRDAILALRSNLEMVDIDEFVQSDRAGPVLRNIQNFAAYLDDPASTFYRYEEVIFNKREWVRQIARDLSVELSDGDADAIADLRDIRPTQENVSAHIRQVTPGGYRSKLSEDSIRFIETKYPVFFTRYGYR